MYFPYFRGRQYEMLALRELVSGRLLSKSVVPVVEPVKLTSTFEGTLRAFTDTQSRIALIFNPTVGEFAGADNFVDVYNTRVGTITNVAPALLMSKNTGDVLQALTTKGVMQSDITAILDKRDFLEEYKKYFADTAPQYTLFPDERQIRRTVMQGKVIFEDKFVKQDKNSDYQNNPDEFFSEDHLYYLDEGYTGFGDYSVVGNIYDESGFAPRAVAIHIVYFDDNNILRIRHFVSDSNMGIEDVAGKYYEAVVKLADWYNDGQQQQLTSALSTLLDHAANGYYPGLPTIKKLTIMHHLELMSKYLDGEHAK
jgi:hypothetical protein